MKTRKMWGLFAMTTLLVGTGCSTDEVVNDYSPENAIQFGTYVGRNAESRASVIDDEALAEKGFGVFAYYTDEADFNEQTSIPNFMYNQQVTGASTTTGDGTSAVTTYTWTYSPLKYWPNEADDKLTFFAYAPYATETNRLKLSAVSDKRYPTVIYEMDVDDTEKTIAIPTGNDVDGMVDVLYLTNADDVDNLTKQTIGETVHFEFGHALSRVAFAARVMVDEFNTEDDGDDEGTHTNVNALDEATTITINSVKLTGAFHTKGTMNLNTGNWTFDPVTPTDQVSYVLDTDNFKTNENVFTSTKMATTDLLNNDESYIMLFPQSLDENNTITVTVDYDVVTEDDAFGEGGDVKVNNVITSESFYFENGFEQGSAYKFVLHLGMTSVKLSVEVAGWDTENAIAVNVPLNIEDNETSTDDEGSGDSNN